MGQFLSKKSGFPPNVSDADIERFKYLILEANRSLTENEMKWIETFSIDCAKLDFHGPYKAFILAKNSQNKYNK